MDSFVEVNSSKWSSLLEHFEEKDGIIARVAIKNSIWMGLHTRNITSRLYVPYGYSDEGVIIVHDLKCGILEVSLLSSKEDPSKLMRALIETSVIDLSSPILFASVTSNVAKPLKLLLNSFNIQYKIDVSHLVTLTNNKVTSFNVESHPGTVIKHVGEGDSELVDKQWPYNYPGSEKYFRNLIQNRMGVGIYGRDDDNLRAWVFYDARGDLHHLCVLKEHRRKKYGQLLVKYLSKMTMERGMEVYACVLTNNHPSKNLFSGLGFEFTDVVEWIECNYEKLKL